MRKSILSLLLPGLAALSLTGCSGGGEASSALVVRCGSGAAFCVASCDFGCTETGGLALTEIAENQTLRFVFNKPVDVASVNGTSFALRTASGQSPEGDLLVSGHEVRFVPRITTSGGFSRFGFTRNETYVLTLAGGDAGFGIRSVSGDRLAKDFTGTLSVTLGIIDLDRAPPRAELLLPTNLTQAPADTSIVVRFSELIDTGPFQGASTLSIPIKYLLRRSRQVGSIFECDTTAVPINLEGSVRLSTELVGGTQVTSVSMKPSVRLPGNSCVQVLVSSDVRDLAGVAAEPATFTFIAEAGTIQEFDVVEDFAGPAKLDVNASAGAWNNGARPGLLGGDGRHGVFDASLGTPVGSNIFEWDTDSFTIPANRTLSGLAETITDGRFFWSELNLPDGYTVRFKGSKTPQFFVRGRAEVAGRFELNAAAMGNFTVKDGTNNIPTSILPGQPGGLPGPGGGRGGRGGNRCNGLGPNPDYNGQNGENARLPAGHAYTSRTAGTGGLGSPLHPAAGTTASVTFTVSFAFNGQLQSGGGGGGNFLAGGQGTIPTPPQSSIPNVWGTPTNGGTSLNLFPIPGGAASLSHFLVGGSGGGGGGSHPFLSITGQVQDQWRAGAGGSGGGGAMALRSGGSLIVRSTGVLEAKGGAGFNFFDRNIGIPAPGGGGSGGSFVLQSGTDLAFNGRLDTAGGAGSSTGNIDPVNLNAVARGGAGSSGFYRLEAGGNLTMNPAAAIPAYQSSTMSGPLNDRDSQTGSRSTWYGTARIFPPDWLYYRLEVDLDGNGTVDAVFSDDPAQGAPANSPTGPVRIMFQGARVSATTNEPTNTPGPWRDFVNGNAGPFSINTDGATGFRFLLLFNRGMNPNAVVKRLTLRYRG